MSTRSVAPGDILAFKETNYISRSLRVDHRCYETDRKTDIVSRKSDRGKHSEADMERGVRLRGA